MKKWMFVLMLITIAARVSAVPIPYEAWMGAYIGKAKVGYISYKIDEADVDGVKGYRIASVMNNRLTVLGTDLTQLVTTVVYADKNFSPLKEDFEMASGGKSTKVSAVFSKDKVDCVLYAGEGSSKKTISIPPGANLVGDAVFSVMDPTPTVGKEYKLSYFNPLTLAIDELLVKVERREKITVGGKEQEAFVMTNSSPLGEMTVWQDDAGELLQVRAMAGITMVRESMEQATTGLEGTNEDFAVLTSVKVDKPIPNPREVTALDVVLDGLTESDMLINDMVQTARPVKNKPGAVRFHIITSSFDPFTAMSLPIRNATYKEFLASTPYIDYDVGGVKAQTKEIVGDEKNAYRACAKLRAWIYGNMQTRADIGITRSTSDVLKSKVGVCRDYAILFAGMARSVGIPSKLAAGLLYTNGAFYYHAWVECYVGEWVPFDATLATDSVDATHIKLAEGSATSMFTLSRVIGNLKAEIKGIK